MLKEITLTELAKRSGCSVAELKRAISTETEESLAFDEEGAFITDVDLDAIKERAGLGGKKRWEEGLIKEIRNEEGLDFHGKTKENLLNALKEKYQKDSSSEPNQRILELEEDKKKLQQAIKETEEKLENEAKQFNHKLTHLEIETLIKSTLPETLANGLSRELAYKLYKVDREFVKTDTGLALLDPVTKEVMKDKRLNPVSITDDLKAFMSQFGETNQGRGGGDDKGQKKSNIESFTKSSEVQKYFADNEIPMNEQAGILAKAMKNEGFKITE